MGAQISKPSRRVGMPVEPREATQENSGALVDRKPSHFAFHINDQPTTAQLHRSPSGRIELWDVPSETTAFECDDVSSSSTALSISPGAREQSPYEGVRAGVEEILLRSDGASDEVASGDGKASLAAPSPSSAAAPVSSPAVPPSPVSASLPLPPAESELRDLLELQSLNLGLVSGGDSPPFVGELRVELVAASLLASRAKVLRSPYAILEGEQDKMDAMPASVLGSVRGRGQDAVVRLAWPKPPEEAAAATVAGDAAARELVPAPVKPVSEPSMPAVRSRQSIPLVASPAVSNRRPELATISPVGSLSSATDGLARDSPANPLDPTSPCGPEKESEISRRSHASQTAMASPVSSPTSSCAPPTFSSPTSTLPRLGSAVAPSTPVASSEVARMPRSKCVFYVVHSDASISISLKDMPSGFGRRTRVLGEARLRPAQLAQGPSELRLDLLHPSKGTVVGVVSVRVSYRFMRGTFDHGGRLGAERFVLARSGRSMRGRGARAAFENVSQVNHKIMSHDALYVLPEGWERGAAWPEASEAPEALHSPQGFRVAPSPASSVASSVAASLPSAIVDPADAQYARSFVRPAPFQPTEAKKLTSKPCHFTAPTITGRFEYCVGRPASNRHVALFARRAAEMPDSRASIAAALERGRAAAGATASSCAPSSSSSSSHLLPCYLGKSQTDHAGRMSPVHASGWAAQRPGQVEVLGVLPDDVSCARGSLFVCQPGTKAVVFDLDGTLTLSDSQVIAQAVLDSVGGTTSLADELIKLWDPRPRRGALHVARAWAAKGYQIVYLSARYGALHALTLDWLSQHGYPPGPVCLRPGRYPTRFPAARFKADVLLGMRAAGIEFVAGYGNQPTDVTAYRAAGIPDAAIRIAGHAGGINGSVPLGSWTDHLVQDLADLPLAPVPTPYAELTFPKQPMYVKRKAEETAKAGVLPRALTAPAGGLPGASGSRASRASRSAAIPFSADLRHSRSFAPSPASRFAASPAPSDALDLEDLDEELRVRAKSAPVLARRKSSFASKLLPRGILRGSTASRRDDDGTARGLGPSPGTRAQPEQASASAAPASASASAGRVVVARRLTERYPTRPASSDPIRPGRAPAGGYAMPATSAADSGTHSQSASSSSFEGGSVSPPCPAAPAVSIASSETSAAASPAKADREPEVESAEAASCRRVVSAAFAPRRTPACEGGRI